MMVEPCLAQYAYLLLCPHAGKTSMIQARKFIGYKDLDQVDLTRNKRKYLQYDFKAWAVCCKVRQPSEFLSQARFCPLLIRITTIWKERQYKSILLCTLCIALRDHRKLQKHMG